MEEDGSERPTGLDQRTNQQQKYWAISLKYRKEKMIGVRKEEEKERLVWHARECAFEEGSKRSGGREGGAEKGNKVPLTTKPLSLGRKV